MTKTHVSLLKNIFSASNFFMHIFNMSLSYDVASESVIKPCIKNDNQLVD